jgi:GT2 family glycosyltransferase
MAVSAPAATVAITVAICTRGRAASLRRTLESLRGQAPAPAEILVVDNAPADDATRATVAAFTGVRYVVEPAPGLDFARNRALRTATQEIVVFLDDDAAADPGWSGAVAAAFAADPQLGACTSRVEPFALDSPGERLFEANGGFFQGDRPIRLPEAARGRLHGRRAPLIAWTVSIGSGCGLAVRRSVALGVGGFDEALDLGPALPGGGDHDMLWRILRSGARVGYEPAARLRHAHRADERAAVDQIVGHQRALVALLTKSLRDAPPGQRAGIAGFLLWRLLKPGTRLARRMVGRDPLPLPALARMWLHTWRGLGAYPAARRVARQRREAAR